LLIAKIYEEAGLPPGLLNVLMGDVKEIGDAFTLHPSRWGMSRLRVQRSLAGSYSITIPIAFHSNPRPPNT
jgi:hypothetical protein